MLQKLRKLKKIRIDKGHVSMKTLELFPRVQELEAHCEMDPSIKDMLSFEYFSELRRLSIHPLHQWTHKVEKLLHCLDVAQNLQELEIDVNKQPVNRFLHKFFEEN